MRRLDVGNREVFSKDYRVFKGYSVKTKKRIEIFEQQFIVPWEMVHDDGKKSNY